MSLDDIREKLRETMKRSSPEKRDWDQVSGATAISSLGFDSLSILDLIYDIQQDFDLEFEAEELVNVKTVDELAAFLQARAAS